MNLNLLNETYSMVKSKLHFMVFDHTGLTGGTHKFDRSDKTCQFWVRTYASLFFGKACVLENIQNVQNNLKMLINNTSPM
jgi:hypothetical protein